MYKTGPPLHWAPAFGCESPDPLSTAAPAEETLLSVSLSRNAIAITVESFDFLALSLLSRIWSLVLSLLLSLVWSELTAQGEVWTVCTTSQLCSFS